MNLFCCSLQHSRHFNKIEALLLQIQGVFKDLHVAVFQVVQAYAKHALCYVHIVYSRR